MNLMRHFFSHIHNQSINQTNNKTMYFKERFKLYNLQLYINILFLHDIIMIITIMKTNEPLEWVIVK